MDELKSYVVVFPISFPFSHCDMVEVFTGYFPTRLGNEWGEDWLFEIRSLIIPLAVANSIHWSEYRMFPSGSTRIMFSHMSYSWRNGVATASEMVRQIGRDWRRRRSHSSDLVNLPMVHVSYPCVHGLMEMKQTSWIRHANAHATKPIPFYASNHIPFFTFMDIRTREFGRSMDWR